MKIKFFLNLIIFTIVITSCKTFSPPSGKVEIISTDLYESGTSKYCAVYLKVTNTSSKKIYTTTISIKATTTKNRTKSSTITSTVIIQPQKSITETCILSFIPDKNESDTSDATEKNDEQWDAETISIIDFFFD